MMETMQNDTASLNAEQNEKTMKDVLREHAITVLSMDNEILFLN